ncbi:MAG: FAD-dependent oxidoreductase [Candidatus Eisenbacteria bacterium]|nr:FAD-dependent oxidoreductase [Candidatus Eisenbacteria bacterium]
MSQVGTPSNPLRVAIIGSGPSGFYAADFLQKTKDLSVAIDMYDRLPTPFGLVRGGVAPDHQKIKTVIKAYEKVAQHPSFRFFGNVAYGTDLSRLDLESHYHGVIYSVGSETDRRMGVPGEDLTGSHPATKFVGWYNAHPDYREEQFDLTQENVAVVGIGNVAMDVIRILARSQSELMSTDIADYAMEALAKSKVKNIYVLARRGPAQAAYTNPEIKELGEMEEADVTCPADEAELDEYSREWLTANPDRTVETNVEVMQEYAKRTPTGKRCRIHFRFLVSPVELIGNGKVEAVKIVKNKLVKSDDGSMRPKATDQFETIPVGLVFRSVGYMGLPLPGLPFDQKAGTFPHEKGRILDPETKQPLPGHYCAGWIKRGPSGVIGTNKPDAQESAQCLLDDLAAGTLLSPGSAAPAAVETMLQAKGVRYVSYAEWQRLDQLELERGAAVGRPRNKFSRVDEMLKALGK